MSIMQEYEWIQKSLTKEVNEGIQIYLDTHQDILLSDIYYTPGGWDKFQAWFMNYRYDYCSEKMEKTLKGYRK